MTAIIIAIIVAFIGGAVGSDGIVTGLLDSSGLISFYVEQYFSSGILTGSQLELTSLFNVAYQIGIGLIILKFVKKGFEQYVLWTDGDPDLDPLNFVVNFLRAIVYATIFDTAYYYIVVTVLKVNTMVLGAFGIVVGEAWWEQLLDAITGNLFQAVGGLIMIIIYFILQIQLIGRGVEMLILRLGYPIACVGLIDSDKGVYAPYVRKFVQCFFTVIVQLMLIKLTILVASLGHFIYAIAIGAIAIKSPKILQEFMLFTTGGDGGIGGAYHAVKLFQMVKGASSGRGGGE